MDGGAACVIFDERGRVLLIKENYDRRRWGLPGGAVEPGESPEEAVVREVLEETCVHVRVDGRIGRYAFTNGWELDVYACSIVAGQPRRPETAEIDEVAWLAPDEIPHPQTNNLIFALPDALAGERDLDRRGLVAVT